jgi:hypothetical protein
MRTDAHSAVEWAGWGAGGAGWGAGQGGQELLVLLIYAALPPEQQVKVCVCVAEGGGWPSGHHW